MKRSKLHLALTIAVMIFVFVASALREQKEEVDSVLWMDFKNCIAVEELNIVSERLTKGV